ncbi:MAG: hypothetical protein H0W72_06815 [Planctomycetes bacterium]|nr:hypothetical protein [Planctomycetota bacterium]
MERAPTTASLVARLAQPEGRAAAARALAQHAGADDLLVFVADPDIPTLLPARGFARTLPGALTWQRFVAEVVQLGRTSGTLPFPTVEVEVACIGRSLDGSAAIVFLGGRPDAAIVEEIVELLPLLAAVFQSERSVVNAQATMALARNAAKQLREQAMSVEQARRMAHEELLERRRAEEALAAKAVELERSNRELQQFAAIVSHDLQEPLRMVSNYMALMQRRLGDALDEKSKLYIGYATSGTERMAKLIRALLDYAQVGAIDRPFEMVPLEAVAHEAIANVSQRIAESSASVRCGDLPCVPGDHILLTQLFQNLLSNAIKFARPGVPPIVSITASESADAWRIEVSDNGIGIAPEHLARIFDVFQRVYTRAEYEGNGIGLATCKRIVDQHAGHLAVESVTGAGSTFRIDLPKSPTANRLGRIGSERKHVTPLPADA